MEWNLYSDNNFLPPLCFSNGKNQNDVVNEILSLINKGKKIIFVHGVCGTGKCLEKNSLVFCKPKGENSFSYHKISDLKGKEGKIISLDKKGNLVKAKFNYVRKTGRKKLFKLKTRAGREIMASSNHPFLTITQKGLEWIPLEKLKDKSYLCLPNRINLDENSIIDENEIKILAHLIAEGKLEDKAGSPKYYQSQNQNPLIRKDYISALKERFPRGEIKERGDEITIKFGLKNTTKGTTNKLRLLVRKYGLDGKKSNNKFVPKQIFGLKNREVSIFLSRLFSCDGSICKRKSGQIVIEYCSISKRLIYDVSILLQKFGIQHTITSNKFKEKKEYSYRISISESKNLRKYIQEIGFVGRKQEIAKNLIKNLKNHKFTNLDKVPRIIREYMKSLGHSYLELDRFLNYEEILEKKKKKSFKEIRKDKLIKTPQVFKQSKIDFLRSHIIKANKQIKDSTLSFISSPDIFWDKVKSIEYVKEDETYDLEVEENHNFIANGIIVHNSAIALNLALSKGKTSIVVPGKNLQAQYKRDYEGKKYLIKPDGTKLKISIITGRNNHKCKFLEDSKNAIPKIKKETNASLHDIFSGKKEDFKDKYGQDVSADNKDIPCKIEIKDSNWPRIKEYLRQNQKVDLKNFSKINDVKRLSIAPVCPYWSPVYPEQYELKSLTDAKKRSYLGLENIMYIQYKRTSGCGFYEQFDSYIDSDVIVFNSLKYKLETSMNRKPKTEIEVIDECDEFLDSLSNQRTINIERLQASLIQALGSGEGDENTIDELLELIKYLKRDSKLDSISSENEIIDIKSTQIFDIVKIFLREHWLKTIDDESYLFDVLETAKMFKDFLDETYLTITKKDNNFLVSLVTTNLAKKLKEYVDKNEVLVLMSGTLHSEEVLRNIFGLNDFEVVDAESKDQGSIRIKRTGLEIDCKYSNFSNNKYSRKDYLLALNESVKIAKRPTLVHVNAFLDIPTEDEIKKYFLDNLISREELKSLQSKDKTGKLTTEFKKGKRDVLFSTRDSRGVDFPGEECNSIVFTKYPNPNVKDSFWKILMKTKPQYYWAFYRDKAKREFLQKIYRGLRFKEDKIELLSPDIRVLDLIEKEKRFNLI